MYLARVNFIKDLHQYEGVEDDGEMLGGIRVQGQLPAVVDIEQCITWKYRQRAWQHIPTAFFNGFRFAKNRHNLLLSSENEGQLPLVQRFSNSFMLWHTNTF